MVASAEPSTAKGSVSVNQLSNHARPNEDNEYDQDESKGQTEEGHICGVSEELDLEDADDQASKDGPYFGGFDAVRDSMMSQQPS